MTEKLILGTVQFGILYGISNSVGQVSLEHSLEILHFARQNRISILDTAEAYGTAHSVIGAYHSKFPDDKFQVITKLPHHFTHTITSKIDAYKIELGVDQLFALLFHSFDSYLENENNIQELIDLKNQGSIQYIGVSVYTNEEFNTVIHDSRIDLIQLPFNVFDNLNLRGKLIHLAKQKGKIIHSRSCFLQGLFFQNVSNEKPIVKALHHELLALNEICQSHEKSIQEVALNYCLQEKNIDNVLIGVDSLNQLRENIQLSANHLSNEIVQAINTIQIENVELLNPSKW